MKEKINLKEVMAQHRKVYELEFSIGSVKLKHLSKVDSMEIRDYLFEKYPEYKDYAEETSVLYDLLKAYGPANVAKDKLDRMKVLAELLKPFVAQFAIPCFIEPKVSSLRELEALGDALTTDEWNKLQDLLKCLTAPLPVSQTDINFVALCKSFGIPMSEDLTAENMTANQYELLERSAIAEETAMRVKMKELQDGI